MPLLPGCISGIVCHDYAFSYSSSWISRSLIRIVRETLHFRQLQASLYSDCAKARSMKVCLSLEAEQTRKATNPVEDQLLFVMIYSYFTDLGGVNGENLMFWGSVIES